MTQHEIATLHAAESRFQDALRGNDLETLDALLHDDVRFIGPDGLTIDKATDLAAHRSGALVIREAAELRRDVQVFGPVGITRATLHLLGEFGGQPLDADLAYTRAWQRHENTWTIVAAHGSVVPRSSPRATFV